MKPSPAASASISCQRQPVPHAVSLTIRPMVADLDPGARIGERLRLEPEPEETREAETGGAGQTDPPDALQQPRASGLPAGETGNEDLENGSADDEEKTEIAEPARGGAHRLAGSPDSACLGRAVSAGAGVSSTRNVYRPRSGWPSFAAVRQTTANSPEPTRPSTGTSIASGFSARTTLPTRTAALSARAA